MKDIVFRLSVPQAKMVIQAVENFIYSHSDCWTKREISTLDNALNKMNFDFPRSEWQKKK